MKWKKAGAKTYIGASNKYIFHVRQEGHGRWVLDIFDNRIKKPHDAYIESFELSSLKEAKHDAETYI